MPKKIDLTGQRFGKLVVIEEADPVWYGKTKKQKQTQWLCQCDCGGQTIVTTGRLRSGMTKSCGCLVVETGRANKKDISGQRFGRLIVIKDTGVRATNGHIMYECLCDCGNTTVVSRSNLMAGTVSSCGCLQKELSSQRMRTHGESHTRLYNVWLGIKDRCYNPHSLDYRWYGARGITMCDDWRDNYVAFRDWALPAGYDVNAPRGECTIDRKDPNGMYCPENCRWADAATQTANRRINLGK